MNEQNLDYLSKQVKFTGFGETHSEELKHKLTKQAPEFYDLPPAGFWQG